MFKGTTPESAEVVKLCGSRLPNPIFPGQNTALLKFVTDRSAAYNGFDITYTSSPEGIVIENITCT